MGFSTAVIGVGNMGRNHARLYSEIESADLVGVCDLNNSRAEKVALKFATKPFFDYKKMLDEVKPQVVSVAVPVSTHKKVVLDCFDAGCNVLVEKPIASCVDDALEMIARARRAGLKFMVGHVERFNPVVLKLKELLEKNAVGKIFSVEAVRVGPLPAKNTDVGIAVDLAVHDIDIARFVLDCEVKRVFAETQKNGFGKHEDLLTGLLRFENGAICSLNVNWLTSMKVRKMTVTGEKGVLELDYISQKMTLFKNKAFNYSENFDRVSEGDFIGFAVEKKEPLRIELEHFVDCVREDKKPFVSGEEGVKALEVALALVESSKKQRAINLN
ncbi:MAG: Gfo/Idh/MocA family oxidoreductase [Candidatus Micrarchaeia archaeon]